MTSSTIDRIAKLLNLAADASASENEVRQALRHAHRLMAEARVTEAEVRARTRDASAPAVDVGDLATVDLGDDELGRNSLASALGRVCGTRAYRTREGRVIAYGLPGDLATLRALLDWTEAQRERLLAEAIRRMRADGDAAWHYTTPRRYSRAYRLGFADGIVQAAAQAKEDADAALAAARAAHDTAATCALVAVQSTALQLSTALAQFRAKLGLRPMSRTCSDSTGYSAGRTAGAAQRLSRNVIR